MNKSLSLLIMAGVLFTSQPVRALTNKQVFAWTNGLATVSAGAMYFFASPGEIVEFPFDSSGIRPTYGLSVGLTAGTYLGVNRFFNWILSRYTPSRRYEWAQEQLTEFGSKYLFNHEITQDNIAQVLQESGCEASELPLVSAFIALQSIDNQLTYMIDQLNRGINDEGHSNLSKKMRELIVRINSDLKKIRVSEAIIKMQPQWLEQWKIYDHRRIEHEKMIYQSMPQTHFVWHR